jgi:transposase
MKRQFVNQVNHRHARIILLSRGGLRNAQIAQHCDCTATWVRRIIHRFNTGGLAAITWYPYYCSPTGPRKFMAEVTEQIYEVALSPAKKLIGLAVWSLSKLREYLQKQKIVGLRKERGQALDFGIRRSCHNLAWRFALSS